MMKTFGGSATPVDWGELYTALQSNVVDGAENNTPSVTTAFHHEVVKYYSVNEHTMCPDVIIISLATWQKLTEQERNCCDRQLTPQLFINGNFGRSREAIARGDGSAWRRDYLPG